MLTEETIHSDNKLSPEAEKVLHAIDSDYKKCSHCGYYHLKKDMPSGDWCERCYWYLYNLETKEDREKDG